MELLFSASFSLRCRPLLFDFFPVFVFFQLFHYPEIIFGIPVCKNRVLQIVCFCFAVFVFFSQLFIELSSCKFLSEEIEKGLRVAFVSPLSFIGDDILSSPIFVRGSFSVSLQFNLNLSKESCTTWK